MSKLGIVSSIAILAALSAMTPGLAEPGLESVPGLAQTQVQTPYQYPSPYAGASPYMQPYYAPPNAGYNGGGAPYAPAAPYRSVQSANPYQPQAYQPPAASSSRSSRSSAASRGPSPYEVQQQAIERSKFLNQMEEQKAAHENYSDHLKQSEDHDYQGHVVKKRSMLKSAVFKLGRAMGTGVGVAAPVAGSFLMMQGMYNIGSGTRGLFSPGVAIPLGVGMYAAPAVINQASRFGSGTKVGSTGSSN